MTALTAIPLPSIAGEVLDGLSRTPKSLPPKLFYDAAGSILFNRITELPEYYLTRAERSFLEVRGAEICDIAGRSLQVVELGPGDGSKAELLLGHLARRQLRVDYIPLDISHEALLSASERLHARFTNVHVRPVVADMSQEFALPPSRTRRLVLYLGSSIGNFDPPDAIALLRRIRRSLRKGDQLLLGADLVKPEATLVAAYDDPAGVTASFNKNLLGRINRELGGHFNLGAFRHLAQWNAAASRMEMYLESLRDQRVTIDRLGRSFLFGRGERIHTENSYKYTIESARELLRGGGFDVRCTWTDPGSMADAGPVCPSRFSLHLASAGRMREDAATPCATLQR